MRRRRYPSDTTDAELSVIEPLFPPPACTRPAGGGPEKHPRREIIDALRYVVSEGCRLRALPADFPPHQTVYGFFRRWIKSGAWHRIRDRSRREVRCQMGTSPNAVATVLDSQSVEASDTVGKHRTPHPRPPPAARTPNSPSSGRTPPTGARSPSGPGPS
ncbi:transposase [Streptomyces sp. BG9H]|uniref:Transposase n=1 Tax=Streptomyces anatolicus TaxID=2675858 RepID=A0ABS6YKT8_9ACTN|nr:transposase [Streptomyces anatolicus]